MKVYTEKNETTFVITKQEDLWYLSKIIREKDFVSGTTIRVIKHKNSIRANRGEKRKIWAKIEVKNVNLQEILRITGIIRETNDENVELGSYHTFNIKVGDKIKLHRNLTIAEIKLVERAEEEVKKVYVLSIEYGLAVFAEVKEDVRILERIDYKVKKHNESSLTNFFSKIQKCLEKYEIKELIICGPGFIKKYFVEYLQKSGKAGYKLFLEDTGNGGERGIYEAIKRGAISKVRKKSRLEEELNVFDKILEEISKDGLVAYGIEEVFRCAEIGNIDTLMVLAELIKDEKVVKIIELVERNKGKILIIKEKGELTLQLKSLGGIAALLRYKL